MDKQVDVAIIGAGTAGINAMNEVRKVTDNFVLINGGLLGTTCARVGCMPSKAAIQVADDYHRRQLLGRQGIHHGNRLTLDLSSVLGHIRQLRDGFVGGIIDDVIKPLDDKFIEGYAEFLEPTELLVNGRKIRADKTIIATGSRPVFPQKWKQFEDRILTTDTIFEQTDLPNRLAVIGLGAVGLEMGQALTRLGLSVSGFDMLSHIGGLQDPEVNRVAVDIISSEFPMHLGSPAEIEGKNGALRISSVGASILADKVLVSMGRIPNVDRLRLDRLGVELDDHGLPPFDYGSMQIADLPVFIAGDVDNYLPVLHEAAYEGTVAGFNAVQPEVVRFLRKVPVTVCFSDPNICTVGASWDEVKEGSPAIGEALSGGGRSQIMLRDSGILRIYADPQSGKLLGGEMATLGGEHISHLLAWSIQQGMTVADALKMVFYHPALEETLRSALNDVADNLPSDSTIPRGLERAER